jgi:hypothetical protein
MRVVYEITDSQQPLWQTPNRQVVSQFMLTIVSSCDGSKTVSHADFADIVYYVGADSAELTFSPTFSGVDNTDCPQQVTLHLRFDG